MLNLKIVLILKYINILMMLYNYFLLNSKTKLK